jgi:cell division protein ZapD
VTSKIYYEQPLNERVRVFLRLEHLFQQADHHLQGSREWDSRAAMFTLTEILGVFSRTDLKNEIMKELERHASTLARMEVSPGVDQRALAAILDQLEGFLEELYQVRGPIGSALRQNEFLTSVMQRVSIPGGTCAFDLPAFHFWLQRPPKERTHNLGHWLDSFSGPRRAVELILRLVRDSTVPTWERAQAGFFQQVLNASQPVQLIRVGLDAESPLFPEISGGKHRFTIRFLLPSLEDRPAQTESEVDFELARCIL